MVFNSRVLLQNYYGHFEKFYFLYYLALKGLFREMDGALIDIRFTKFVHSRARPI